MKGEETNLKTQTHCSMLKDKKEVIDWNTVLVNKLLMTETPLKCPQVLAGHASGCWLSALGAGVPYNRENMKVYFVVAEGLGS